MTAQTTAKPGPNGSDKQVAVTVTNNSATPTVGFFLRADIRRGTASGAELAGDNELQSSIWSDNDVTLWPGESETLTASYNSADLQGATPVVSVSGWNMPKVDVVAGTGTGVNDFSLAASPPSGSVAAGSSATSTVSTAVVSGSAESVALTASGLPSGATATFAPTSVTAGGNSTLTIGTSAATPAGTYPITITGTAPSATHTATYTLTVTGGPTSNAIVNGGFETGNLTGWTQDSGSSSVVTSPTHSGGFAALVGSTSKTSGTSRLTQTFTARDRQQQLVVLVRRLLHGYLRHRLGHGVPGRQHHLDHHPSAGAGLHHRAGLEAGHHIRDPGPLLHPPARSPRRHQHPHQHRL